MYKRDDRQIDLGSDTTFFLKYETPAELASISFGWTGADATDGTIDIYVGDFVRSDMEATTNLSQLGSTITLSAANSNLAGNLVNYGGIVSAIRVVYTANSNTTGTGYLIVKEKV